MPEATAIDDVGIELTDVGAVPVQLGVLLINVSEGAVPCDGGHMPGN